MDGSVASKDNPMIGITANTTAQNTPVASDPVGITRVNAHATDSAREP